MGLFLCRNFDQLWFAAFVDINIAVNPETIIGKTL